MTSAALPDSGYARLVNADPVTGTPAVLGEWAARLEELEAPGASRVGRGVQPLLDGSPGRNGALARLAGSGLHPTCWLLRFGTGGFTVLREEPLALSPEARFTFLHRLLRGERIDEDTFLRSVPPDLLLPRGARLAEGRNDHLTPVTRGLPLGDGLAGGTLRHGDLGGEEAGPPGEPRIVVVDRVEAHHVALFQDPSCRGLLALRGSAADHFALLARERGFPYLVLERHRLDAAALRGPEGDLPLGTTVTVDFSAGVVYRGRGVFSPGAHPAAGVIGALLRGRPGPLPLRLNLDADEDLAQAPGEAAGIGLWRTEHLLRRLGLEGRLREVLEAEGGAAPEALAALVEGQCRAFRRALAWAAGRPVAVRLLDFPLHELGGPLAGEVNPMLGLRGVRQGLRWPQVYRAQLLALLWAVRSDPGPTPPRVEVTLPLVGDVEELRLVRGWVEETWAGEGALPRPRVGAMVETPAAALLAGSLAAEGDFLSFGTNDLTQFTLGLSREDYLPVLRAHRDHGLWPHDPFAHLHPAVLRLMRAAATEARAARPGVRIGVCGAHAADPQLLDLCREGLIDELSVPRHLFARVRLQAWQALTSSQGTVAQGTGPEGSRA